MPKASCEFEFFVSIMTDSKTTNKNPFYGLPAMKAPKIAYAKKISIGYGLLGKLGAPLIIPTGVWCGRIRLLRPLLKIGS